GLYFRWRQQPPLQLVAFVRPLDALRFAPSRADRGVILRHRLPLTDGADRDFRWLVKVSSNRRTHVSIARHRKVWEIAERMQILRTFPKLRDLARGQRDL